MMNNLSTTILENEANEYSNFKPALSSNDQINRNAFVCGTLSKPLGSNVVIAEKSRVLSKVSNQNKVFCRHKKWLDEMKDKKEKKEKEIKDKNQIKEGKKLAFIEKRDKRHRTYRKRVKKKLSFDSRKDNNGIYNTDFQDKFESESKPAWSLSESTALHVQEAKKIGEENELMHFVNSLDFEQYANDMELNLLIKKLEERVKFIAKEKKKEESKLQTIMDPKQGLNYLTDFNKIKSEIASLRTAYDNPDGKELNEPIGEKFNKNNGNMKEDYIRSITQDVLNKGGDDVTSIHSCKSIQMLVKRASGRLESPKNLSLEISLTPPLTITHREDDGARLAETKSLSKLPFKNRNPAI